jgi:hypothetical protein
MGQELTHEPDANRYVLRVDGVVASVLDIAERGEAISFTRAFTNPALRGRGYADVVTTFAVDDAERRGLTRMVPTCWYVAEWFDRHPEKAHLLNR